MVVFTPHINDFASFQEPKDAAARGHDAKESNDAKLVPKPPVEETGAAAKPKSKVSLASGCCWCPIVLVNLVGSSISYLPPQEDATKEEEHDMKPEATPTDAPESTPTDMKPESTPTDMPESTPTDVKPESTPKTDVKPEATPTDVKPKTTPTDVKPEATPTVVAAKPESEVSLCIGVIPVVPIISVVCHPYTSQTILPAGRGRRRKRCACAGNKGVCHSIFCRGGDSGAVMNLLHVLKTADLARLKLQIWDTACRCCHVSLFTFTMKLSAGRGCQRHRRHHFTCDTGKEGVCGDS